jgi:hypothetical protein
VNAVPDYTEVKWTKAKGGSVTDINPATPPGKYSGGVLVLYIKPKKYILCCSNKPTHSISYLCFPLVF